MTPEQRARFILAVHKKTLQHFDAGGTVLTGPSNPTVPNAVNPQNNGPLGSISTTLGTSNTFQASGAPIQAGTTAGQLNSAYSGVQGALGAQSGLASTLNPQVAGASAAQAGAINQLEGIANGQGPNPALAQLNQTTGQNINAQAALMAGQRGASANPGLIARQIAQQGASTQQQAAGQAATLEAQQQLGALGEIGGLTNNAISQAGQATTNATQAQENEQATLQNANTSLNNAITAQQGNINNTNAQVAQANANQNNNILGDIGNGLSSAASGIASLFEKGGRVQKMADGGAPNLGALAPTQTTASGLNTIPGIQLENSDFVFSPGKSGGAAKSGSSSSSSDEWTDADGNVIDMDDSANQPGGANFVGPLPPAAIAAPDAMARGGTVGYHEHFRSYFSGGSTDAVPAMVSAKEVYLNPKQVKQVLKGADPMKIGRKFEGKAQVKDDSLKNDTIKATLKEGGIVIPRHITTHQMSSEKAAAFVRRVAAQKGFKAA